MDQPIEVRTGLDRSGQGAGGPVLAPYKVEPAASIITTGGRVAETVRPALPDQSTTTIFPFALFASMTRCASTSASKGNVGPSVSRSAPSSTILT